MDRENRFCFGVTLDSICEMSMLKVSGSISQKITLPPRCSITFVVDIHVNAGTIASSPDLNPKAAITKDGVL